MVGDKKVYFQLQWSQGSGQYGWSSFQHHHSNEERALTELREAREKNKHRDDKTRSETRPCKIWTPDGTWASYRSAATNYRLIKTTVEVIEEIPIVDPTKD